MIPLVPGEFPDLRGTSIFLGAGRLDPIVPNENTERLAAMLRDAGAELELFWHMGGHSLAHQEVERAKQWLAEPGPPERFEHRRRAVLQNELGRSGSLSNQCCNCPKGDTEP
jgi:hypothetical protein